MKKTLQVLLTISLICLAAGLASAQALPPAQGGGPLSPTAQGGGSFMVQCPKSTLWHPAPFYSNPNTGEPAYTGPAPVSPVAVGKGVVFDGTDTEHPVYMGNGGQIKCQEISGGDGYMTESDGNQTYMFSLGPLSGLDKIKNGQPGTDFPDEFNQPYCDASGSGTYTNGQPNPYVAGQPNPLYPNVTLQSCGPNGAVGYQPPAGARAATASTALYPLNTLTCTTGLGCPVSGVIIVDAGAGYTAPPFVTFPAPDCAPLGPTCVHVQATASAVIATGSVVEVTLTNAGGNGYTVPPVPTFSAPSGSPISGTDPAAIMNTGTMNGNIPGPLMAFDEDDEFFLTLTNVGMIMRPDLFEQHTVHFHGYPNASSFYDGVPDASVAINIGASFTYYYLAPDAGTYFWHCHITPPEHLQMGMVGQLFVRPRQNRVPVNGSLYASLAGGQFGPMAAGSTGQQDDLRTACQGTGPSPNGPIDILCSVPLPAH